MKEIFLIADTHFGHKGVCNFLRSDGTKLRPWENPDEMDEYMVEKWNSVVKPTDKVYHLGDVVINRKALKTLSRLNGDKVLVKGNHDIFRLEEYVSYFRDVRAYYKLDDFILSHIPIHPHSLARWCGGNIHGHLHDNNVLYSDGTKDHRYYNVSVEQINFVPVSFDEINSNMKIRSEKYPNEFSYLVK